jgi:8-oxo-dGTP diphosphatase
VKKRIEVVGAVIVRDNLILCAKRGPAAKLAGMWEFPGGKIEVGETPQDALVREIAEELDCTISVGEYINTAEYEYDFGVVVLATYYCELTAGSPLPSEHEAIAWLPPHQLDSLDWAPADIPAVRHILGSRGAL